MTRSKLRNKFLKDKSEKSRNEYQKQRNLCVTRLRRAKRQCISNLEPNLVANKKSFGKELSGSFQTKFLKKK